MNKADHLVSVIMPVFNGMTFLPASLESIRAQDYPNLEIIVVDDGSIDKSKEVLESFADSWSGCMKILTHPGRKRQGIAASYRLGLKHCRGKYIAFLEQDDVWSVNKISEQIKVFNALPEVGVVFSDVYTCNEEGRVATKAFKTLINRPPTERSFNAFWRLLWGNCVLTFSNIMVRHKLINISDIITSPGGFQDWMLLLLLSSRCKFYHCSRTKILWRQRQDSYYAKIKRMPKPKSLRKSALRNASEKLLLERQSIHSQHTYIEYFFKSYWHSVISLVSAAERMADFLNRRFFNGEITSFTQNSSI